MHQKNTPVCLNCKWRVHAPSAYDFRNFSGVRIGKRVGSLVLKLPGASLDFFEEAGPSERRPVIDVKLASAQFLKRG